MMSGKQPLINILKDRFATVVEEITLSHDMVTMVLSPANLLEVCAALRDEPPFNFEMLVDICGVDYSDYGLSYWRTEETTTSGYTRGCNEANPEQITPWNKPRFASVYHLLSLSNNQRLRLKTYVDGEPPVIPSVVTIWSSANWYEREAFDLFGIVYDGHPDLRRLLTDYGFVGHPFRKDFPLIGEVELRYDAKQQRCLYEPVSIQPRVLVPKVIRHDSRYLHSEESQPIPQEE